MKIKYINIIVVAVFSLTILSFLMQSFYIDVPRHDKNRGKPGDAVENGRKKIPKPPQGNEAYIVIDRYANKIYLRTEKKVLLEALCSTGIGTELVDSVTGRSWKFDTPAGVFTVESKLENPG